MSVVSKALTLFLIPFNMLIHVQGVVQLSIILCEEKEDHILAATAWALGQIGRHSAEHSKLIATANVLPQLLKLYLQPDSSEDLCSKVREAEREREREVVWWNGEILSHI